MALSGNRGEWSEIYALFKLLGDTQVYAGDADLHRIESLFYPIIRILRSEQTGSYEYVVDGNLIVVTEDGNELLQINTIEFANKAAELLGVIKNSTGSAFSIPEIEEFMHSVKCSALKAKSTDKSDIKIVIHDLRTKINSVLGFSIKSQLGGASTLFNPGKTTNIIYEVTGTSINKDDIQQINGIDSRSKLRDRLDAISKLGGRLSYSDCENNVFKNNLILIDSSLPQIVAEIVKIYYSTNKSTIKEIVEQIELTNPLGFDNVHSHKFYEYKVKRLLTDMALGMTASTVWTGRYDATGGYLVVKSDGDVLCYHVYNKNEFEEYLYANTKLDTPSSTRYGFGVIEDVGTMQTVKLNLQIRFKQ